MSTSPHNTINAQASPPDSMAELLGTLVAHPSRAGVDAPEPVLRVIADWLHAHAIPHAWLRDAAGQPLGLWGEIAGARPGPAYLLDATADTAPFGDPQAWRHPPDRATIEDGWMYGRGAADSKAGIAVFCHVLAELLPQMPRLAGTLCFVFDAEEHSGSFAGIRRYMDVRGGAPLAGAMIGYPGNDRLITGARGFLRARLAIHGMGAHSGASGHRGVNAIDRARLLLQDLADAPLPAADAHFPLPPRITPTSIRGGGSFTLVPDRCELELDMRLTPAFDDARRPQRARHPHRMAARLAGLPARSRYAHGAGAGARGQRSLRPSGTDCGGRAVQHRQLPGHPGHSRHRRPWRQLPQHPCAG
ncbi:MAG: M20/M25/M40 family metallo-hydrolase [Thiobacillus sp.]|nr:M20/M25/M40 family metallo-hydrolase [Thiobacillus sp.]